MDLDTVEARIHCIAGGPAEIRNNAADLLAGECARGWASDHGADARGRVDFPDLAFERDGGGRHRQRAVVKVRVGHAAHVPELQEDPPAGGVDRIGHQSPSGDLLRAVDAGGEGIAFALGRDLGGLGHDQGGTGTLGVVAGIHCVGHVTRLGAARTRHGRHDDAVGKCVAGDDGRREKWRGGCQHACGSPDLGDDGGCADVAHCAKPGVL